MMLPVVRVFLDTVSLTDAIKILKPYPSTRLALLRGLGKFDTNEFIIPLSLIWKTLPASAKKELQDKAEVYVLSTET